MKDTAKCSLDDLLGPIRAQSIQKVVYQKLFRAIMTGRIPPGSRLTTVKISNSLNVSHAPVRVALNWLEAKGFVECQKRMGRIVRKLSSEEQRDLVKTRIILETAAAKIAFGGFTGETLVILEAIVERFKTAASFEETDQLNREFHETLYRDANMPLLVGLITDLYDRFSPYAAIAYQLEARMPDRDTRQKPEYYHMKILESMRRKNLGDLLKYLKMKLARGKPVTEELMKQI